jgi:hypothetical protein
VLEGLLALSDSEKISVARHAAILPSAVKEDAHEALRVRVVERFQEDTVHQGKNGSVRADAESQLSTATIVKPGLLRSCLSP